MNREVLAYIGRDPEPAVMFADRRKQKRVRHAPAITPSEPWRFSKPVTMPAWAVPAMVAGALALHLLLILLLLLIPARPPNRPLAVPVQMVTSIPKAPRPVMKPAAKQPARTAEKKPATKTPKPAARPATKPAPAAHAKIPKPAANFLHFAPRGEDATNSHAKFISASIFDAAHNPHLYCPANAGPNNQGIISADLIITPKGGADVPVYPQVIITQSSGNPIIDNAVQSVLEKWLMTPEIENGKPVQSEMEQTSQPCAE